MDTRFIHRAAIALAIGTPLFLIWGALALGVIGAEGNPADRMYLAVVAVEFAGALLARFRPAGMARALTAAAVATAGVALIALLTGEHRSPVTSVAEILGVNAMFVALFLASAWGFRKASTGPVPAR